MSWNLTEMKLAVVSHKPCWLSASSPSGYATDGGFPFQMRALSELFKETRLCLPRISGTKADGELPLTGNNLTVVPLNTPRGTGALRKLALLPWLFQSSVALFIEIRNADAVHAPIPGDVGTVGMLLAWMMRKPLFVRHCGNWFVQATVAEHFWKWFMERFAGGRNVMLATGGASEPPSKKNSNLRWIFATSLTESELEQAVPRAKKAGSSARLIIVCRQEKEKGTGVVIESLPLIRKSFPQVTLDVVGDGGALRNFRQLAKSLGVDDRITFHGKVDHAGVGDLLQQADVFCYPTTSSEGFPKVVLEALAHGLPVVTTKVSVLPILTAGCGSLIDKAAPADLAQASIDILTDASRYSEMSEQAVRTARQYSLESWRDSIGTLLQSAWGRYLSSESKQDLVVSNVRSL